MTTASERPEFQIGHSDVVAADCPESDSGCTWAGSYEIGAADTGFICRPGCPLMALLDVQITSGAEQ